ncbi:hypothetical protein EDB89DRAFT_1903808 [Lactarius sanguifluus]|nr:hypothetical protein EDB89DRAFT_1903808 [Lactarius sanguifluus]
MSTWREFLVEHAKFPFPDPVENKSVDTTDISPEDVGKVDPKWRAKYAVPDETLVGNLCQTLDNILEDTVLLDDSRNDLLLYFGRHLQFRTVGRREIEDRIWSTNRNEYTALRTPWNTSSEVSLDYLGMVDDKRVVLVEAKSPSVMKAVGSSLPEHTVKMDWTPSGDLVSRVLLKAALCLGLREIEWLFLTCHNSWIVCCLVSDNDNPFLAFSRIFSIEGSSTVSGISWCHFAGEFHPPVALDTIPEEGEGGSSSSPEDVDGSGEYRGRSTANISSTRPITRSRAATSHDAAESELMFTLSSPHYPESFQVWAHLHSLPNNPFALPHCAENGNRKRRLWLTRHIGSGSTGNVWECHFDNGDDLFAIKGDGTGVLILGLCGDTLKDWDELNFSEQRQVYGLVWDLHRLGIIHGDLEPRNIARVPGASVRHSCVEMSGKLNKRYKCPELQAMRGVLKLLRRQGPISDHTRRTPINTMAR